MRDVRFSTRRQHGSQPGRRSARGQLILAAGATVALIAAPVAVSPHALTLSWQLAAAASARGSHDNGRGHGDGDHHNGGAHGNHFGHRDERVRGNAHEADRGHGQPHDNRGSHNGHSRDHGGDVQDQGGSVPVDDEAPPS